MLLASVNISLWWSGRDWTEAPLNSHNKECDAATHAINADKTIFSSEQSNLMSGDDNNESAFNNDDEFSEFDDLLSRVVFDGDDLSSPDVFRDLVVSNDDDECSSSSCTSEGMPDLILPTATVAKTMLSSTITWTLFDVH